MKLCHAVKHVNPNAVDVMYKRGDLVWYRQRDGANVPAKVSVIMTQQKFLHTMLHTFWYHARNCCQVVAVDMAVYPPSYGVQIDDNIRETEAVRLTSRNIHTAEGSSAGSATSGSAFKRHFEQKHSTHHSSFSDSEFDDFQGSSDHASQAGPQHVHTSNAFPPAFPPQQQQQQGSFVTDWHHNPASASAPSGPSHDHLPTHSTEQWSLARQQNGNLSAAYNSHVTHQPAASNGFSARPHVPAHRYANDMAQQGFGALQGSWEAGHAEAIEGNGSEDDDGFGDFAEAPPSPHQVADAHQQAPPVSDRQVFGPAQSQQRSLYLRSLQFQSLTAFLLLLLLFSSPLTAAPASANYFCTALSGLIH